MSNMYIKYADRKKICEKLAAYRVGEIVAVLTDTECEDGLIEAQTKLTITSIKIRDKLRPPTALLITYRCVDALGKR